MKDEHIDASLSKVRSLFEEASDVIEALRPNEKVTATGLAAMIAAKHSMSGATLYPILKMMFDGYPGVSVTRGAKGGIMKLPINSATPDVMALAQTPAIVSDNVVEDETIDSE
jgi:hypothetical protein